ncbi:MAG: mucin-associated surface protein [Myxococcales bacterium]|nr:mucin-associated surface protein [Myxococcales bacterium]
MAADEPPQTVTVVDLDPRAGQAPDPLRWIRRIGYLAMLVIGWLFILWQNKFYISAPAVFVCLGYLAVVSTVYALWRTGVVAVSDEDDATDSTWGRPLGARGELEREKKTLLKAIKEAEFDREMGKLSTADAEQMIAIYRARAIEVIKELDKLEVGTTGTIREQIEREVKARIEIEAKTKKVAEDAAAKKNVKAGKKGAKPDPVAAANKAATAADKAASAAERAAAAATAAASPSRDLDAAGADAAADAAADDAASAASEARFAANAARDAAASVSTTEDVKTTDSVKTTDAVKTTDDVIATPDAVTDDNDVAALKEATS